MRSTESPRIWNYNRFVFLSHWKPHLHRSKISLISIRLNQPVRVSESMRHLHLEENFINFLAAQTERRILIKHNLYAQEFDWRRIYSILFLPSSAFVYRAVLRPLSCRATKPPMTLSFRTLLIASWYPSVAHGLGLSLGQLTFPLLAN
jgi:hypothetical protein